MGKLPALIVSVIQRFHCTTLYTKLTYTSEWGCNSDFCTLALFSTTDVKKLTKEIDTLVSFAHPNVLSLMGVGDDSESTFLILPFMAKGSVLEYVKHHKEELLHTSEAIVAEVCESLIFKHIIQWLGFTGHDLKKTTALYVSPDS